MNDLYKELSKNAVEICTKEQRYENFAYSRMYAELIIIECLSKMSNHLDKQRVIKHFGMIE